MTVSGAGPWAAEIASFADQGRLAGRAETTIGLRVAWIRRVATLSGRPTQEVTAGHLRDVLIGQAWAPETRRAVYQSVRLFFAHLKRAGLLDVDPAADLPKLRRRPATARPIDESDYREAVAAAGPELRLMLRLAGEVGLRRGEIAQVHRDDVVADLLGRSLLVHGKGGRARVVPLPADIGDELAVVDGWVFPGRFSGHVAAQTVGDRCGDHLGRWTLHQLRHRFATAAYEATGDLLAVQQLLGHSTPTITQGYVRLPQDALRRAVDAVTVAA